MAQYLQNIRESASSGAAVIRRVTLEALLIRGVVLITGVLALLMVTPADLRGVLVIVGLICVALLPAILPGSWLVLVLEIAVVLGWIVQTTVLDTPVAWFPLAALATLLYLHHTAAAFAAVVPLDTQLPINVIGQWFTRAIPAIVGGIIVAVAAVILPSELSGSSTLIATLAGVALAVVIAGLLAWLLHRRR